MHYGPQYWRETDVKSVLDRRSQAALQKLADSCALRHQASEGKESRQFHALNHFTATPDHALSDKMNEFYFVSRRFDSCANKHPNVVFNNIAVDFWSTGDVVEFVQRQNKASAA